MNSKLLFLTSSLKLGQGGYGSREWECPELLCEKDWIDKDGTRQDPDKIEENFFPVEKKIYELTQCYGMGEPSDAFNIF